MSSPDGIASSGEDETRINVEDIMKEIRDTIARKKKMGIYSEDEIEEVSKLKLETYADSAEIDTMLLTYLRDENRMWNISSSYRIQSHRGISGRLIVMVKRLVRPFVRLYTDHIVERQAQLNLYTVQVMHNLVREVTRLGIENTQLRHRLEMLEQEHRFVQKRERTLEEMVVYKDERSDKMAIPPETSA